MAYLIFLGFAYVGFEYAGTPLGIAGATGTCFYAYAFWFHHKYGGEEASDDF